MICNSTLKKPDLFFAIILFGLVLLPFPVIASDFDCNIEFSKCKLKARSMKNETPCDAYMICEAIALCDLQFCVCRRAGSGHLGGVGDLVDPALKQEAQVMCGLTHGRTGKCTRIAEKCKNFFDKKYNQSHGSQGGTNKPPKPSQSPNQDDCNPDFDPKNLGGDDRPPCIR